MKKHLTIIAAGLLMLLVFSCGTNDGEDRKQLFIGLETVSVKMGETRSLKIFSGNGGYEVSAIDDDLLSVEVAGDEIKMVPKAEGATTITVTDRLGFNDEFVVVVEEPYLILNFENRNERFQVNVTDGSLRTQITNELAEENFETPDTVYLLRAGSAKQVEVYRSSAFMKVGMIQKSGNYSFSEDGANVIFSYGDGDYGFSALTQNSIIKFKTINNYLLHLTDGQSESISGTKANIISNNVEMGHDFTEKYKQKYPEAGVQSAIVAYTGTIIEYKDF